ncbi:hypothetical protein ACFFF7_10770 [Novosphingobium aquiterrae]|uniref:Capsular polysaccharide biosynthesis protein n=1 Tax=Novosphingobium aquiterrae TaxID=624388 RepID=A0ABV6PJ86_9SPHN
MTAPIEGIGCLAGITPWKRRRLRAIFVNRHGPPVARTARLAVRLAQANQGAVAVWESRRPAGLDERAAKEGVAVWSIEDGFIRSAGLGAALVQPCSLVLDSQRPHYDASAPSDLEDLLQSRDFTVDELARAEALIARLRAGAITKYNLAGKAPDLPKGQRVVLVLGQVDDDLSVLRGGGGQTVAGMVAAARAAEPDALLLFKPHPDVVAGLRSGLRVPPEADRVIEDAGLADLFACADAVHVLTSLGGFEALLRSLPVTVHGQPFFAGWGLTLDRNPVPRRTRRLSLAQLVAGALLAYPHYFRPDLERRCEAEDLLDWLEASGPAHLPSRPWRLIADAARRLGAYLRK